MKRIGVLLAAGESRRMGRPKQLLPWPPKAENAKPLVAAAYDAIARVCDAMVVVVDFQAEAVLAALGERMFYREVVGNAGSPMFISIQIGLRMAQRIDAGADVLLQPADHPEIRLDTLRALATASDEQPDRAVMPQYRGRGGHPAIIPQNVVKLVLPTMATVACGSSGSTDHIFASVCRSTTPGWFSILIRNRITTFTSGKTKSDDCSPAGACPRNPTGHKTHDHACNLMVP